MSISRTSHRYKSIRPDQLALRKRIRELAEARVCYGYQRIHILLRCEGWHVNHKRVHRLYCLEGLNLRRKRPRKRTSASRHRIRPIPTRTNESWSMDFVSDSLFDGRRFRALTLVDNFSRQSLVIHADQKIRGCHVADALSVVAAKRGAPQRIYVDNGPEFVSKDLDHWAYMNRVELHFSRPGKPTDNAMIESFNGRLRDECLNVNWFLSLEDARIKLEAWRRDYNEFRPHSSLGGLTPEQFAQAEARSKNQQPAQEFHT